MLITIIAIQVVGLLFALGWKLTQLWAWPHDKVVRSVTVAIAAEIVSLATQGAAIDTGSALWRLVSQASQLVVLYAIMMVFVYAFRKHGESPETGRRRYLIPLLVAAGLLGLGASITAPGHAGDYTDTGVMISFNTTAVFQIWAWVIVLPRSARYARIAEPRLRRALRIIEIGMVLMIIGGVASIINVTAHWIDIAQQFPTAFLWFYKIGSTIAVLGISIFIVGILYPAISQRIGALKLWFQHRRWYHTLEPLWRRMNQQFPEDCLDQPARGWHRLDPRRIHRQFYRRVIESRDGLVRISPHLDDLGADLRQPSPGHLIEALAAYRHSYAVRPAVPVAQPATARLADDVAELLHLAHALRRHEATREATT